MTIPDLSAGICHNDPDPDQWFRNDVTRQDAADLCAGCSVLSECLAHALAEREFGVWGGMTEQDRMTMRRRLKGTGTVPVNIRGMQCKRGHDLTLPNATYKKRNAATGGTWETCAECKKWREKMRAERVKGEKAS